MAFILNIVLLCIIVLHTDGQTLETSNSDDVDIFLNKSDFNKLQLERIMNGAVGTQEMFPYLVSVQTSSNQHICGGSLLTPFHVLTAAHCTFVKPLGRLFSPEDLQVRLGPSDLRSPASVVARVKWIKVHEKYREKPIDNDIAVLKVIRPLSTSSNDVATLSTSYIRPSSVSGPCIAAGWGRLGPDPPPVEYKSSLNISDSFNVSSAFPNNSSNVNNQSLIHPNQFHNESILNSTFPSFNSSQDSNITYAFNSTTPIPVFSNESVHVRNDSDVFRAVNYVPRELKLRFTLLPLQDAKECAKDYDMAGITNEVLCAGKRDSRTDTCKGDSGGPLICDGKIEGIVSFGDGCDNPYHLGVYTRVYTHLKWIRKQINSGAGTFCCINKYIILFSLLFSVLLHKIKLW